MLLQTLCGTYSNRLSLMLSCAVLRRHVLSCAVLCCAVMRCARCNSPGQGALPGAVARAQLEHHGGEQERQSGLLLVWNCRG